MFGITPKRLFIWVFIGGILYVALLYPPVLLFAWEFDDYVRGEIRFAPAREKLEKDYITDNIAEAARRYGLIVNPKKDIRVTKTPDLQRGIEILTVDVDYKAPVDLYYFTHNVPMHIHATTAY
jgi:hypothetical protein